MKPGITIKNRTVIFEPYPQKLTGAMRDCSGFELSVDQIKMIAFCPRLVMDDETFFLLLIDKLGKIYPMPAIGETEGLLEFEKLFGLGSIAEEWGKFEYDDHYGTIEKIIYPQELYWEDLFERDAKFLFRKLVGGFFPRNFWGNIQEKVREKLIYHE